MRTREQQYAVKAFNCVTERKLSGESKDKYGSMAHKLPVLIRTAGLAQALAFVQARHEKQDEPPRLLLQDLATVLSISEDDLIKRSRKSSLAEYMLLTQQSIDALLWFKRFAESVLGVDSAKAATTDVDKSNDQGSSEPQAVATSTSGDSNA